MLHFALETADTVRGVMEAASKTGHQSLAMLKRYTHVEAEKLAAKLG
ncbi:hypothetical protein THIX_20175 [Thiomonas sp. X19]|nr:hypothetical protein [Thiomonas sp. X19]SCC92125.1 hypothetical protein THIX_20175 [Thiomonas sp. X19]